VQPDGINHSEESRMRRNPHQAWAICLLLGAFWTGAVSAAGPALNPIPAGASVVSGTVQAGTATVSLYDVSYPTTMLIGSISVVSGASVFTCAVNPPLPLGHSVVAVDDAGNYSAPVIVTAAVPAIAGGTAP
jgi:hypothetical protein